ncbi:MAG: hypothetical protein KDN20_04330 [Verrucomicrobiae bacterium]|nr:hypothetical protein [Verrucomicrobiae bacterium]
MNPRFLITLIASLILVTVGGIFALKRIGPEKEEAPRTVETTSPGAESSDPKNVPTTFSGTEPNKAVTTTAPENANETTASREVWDNQIADLLTNNAIENREAGQQLAAIAAKSEAPEEVRVDAIQHALNLIGDEEYMDDMMALAVRTDLPEEMNEIIFSDLHNRPQEISVPVAKEIGRLAKHPLAEEARDFVEFFEADDANLGAVPVN